MQQNDLEVNLAHHMLPILSYRDSWANFPPHPLARKKCLMFAGMSSLNLLKSATHRVWLPTNHCSLVKDNLNESALLEETGLNYQQTQVKAVGK